MIYFIISPYKYSSCGCGMRNDFSWFFNISTFISTYFVDKSKKYFLFINASWFSDMLYKIFRYFFLHSWLYNLVGRNLEFQLTELSGYILVTLKIWSFITTLYFFPTLHVGLFVFMSIYIYNVYLLQTQYTKLSMLLDRMWWLSQKLWFEWSVKPG